MNEKTRVCHRHTLPSGGSLRFSKKGRLNVFSDGLWFFISSGFFHKFRFQIHGAALDFAGNIVITFLQADAFHFSALLNHLRRAFHFQIFNQHHGVAIGQRCAVGIFDYQGVFGGFALLPFVASFGANQLNAVVISEFGTALRAGGQAHNVLSVMIDAPIIANSKKKAQKAV